MTIQSAIEQIERCATCKFSLGLGSYVEFVLCRRWPPNVAPSTRMLANGGTLTTDFPACRMLANGGTLTTDFPTVHPQNWCGEYQPKPERDADG